MSRHCRPGPRLAEFIAAFLLIAWTSSLRADDWPQWRGNGRLAVWNETGLVERFPEAGLSVTWRVPVHAGYSGPAVAGGRVFVTDSRRMSGSRMARTRPRSRRGDGQDPLVQGMGDQLLRSRDDVALGPRATPTVDDDLVYVLGAMGNLFALDVRDGRRSRGTRASSTISPPRSHRGARPPRRSSTATGSLRSSAVSPMRRSLPSTSAPARSMASAVIGLGTRLRTADHRRRRRRQAVDDLAPDRHQLPRSGDRARVLGSAVSSRPRDHRSHARAQRAHICWRRRSTTAHAC